MDSIFSLHHRHQRAAVHPADRDEDEQERTAGTRERQRDPGLTLDLFTLLTFQPLTLHRPALSPPLLTLDSPAHVQKRQTQSAASDWRETYQALSTNHPPFPSPYPSLLSSFSLRCCVSSPLDADSQANVKKQQQKKQGNRCIILIWNSHCGGMKKELQNILMNKGRLRNLVHVLKTNTKKAFCFSLFFSLSLCLLSLSLRLSRTLRRISGVAELNQEGRVVCGGSLIARGVFVWHISRPYSPIWLYILPNRAHSGPLLRLRWDRCAREIFHQVEKKPASMLNLSPLCFFSIQGLI